MCKGGTYVDKTVGDLLADRPLAWVSSADSVRKAIDLMIDNDYSQLPVIMDNGRVVGWFTERRLAEEVSQDSIQHILDLPVGEFLDHEPVRVVGPHRNIYHVARLLEGALAIMVCDDGKAKGIITDYDVAAFLAEISRGISLVEDIEECLRDIIEFVFPTPEARNAALILAFGHDRKSPTLPAKAYDELTLREHGQLITADDNWPRFESYLQPKALFSRYMEVARPIRNQITHFRGALSPQQIKALNNVRGWLRARRSLLAPGRPTIAVPAG